MLQSSCSLHSTLGVLSAASRSFRPSPLIKRLQSWQATILDRIIDGAANSPSPRKWSMKPRTRRLKVRHFQFDWRGNQPRSQGSLPLAAALLRDPSIGQAKEQLSLCRLRRSLATRAGLLKIIPNWVPFSASSGALLNFGSHRYRRQSRHYVKARSLKQSSISFISLHHIDNYKEGNFYLVPLTQLRSSGSFLTKRTVGSLQINNIAGASGKRLKENRPGCPTTVSSQRHWKHFLGYPAEVLLDL